MISLLHNQNISFKADYSYKSLKAKQTLRIEWMKGSYPSDSLLHQIKGHKGEILSHINKNTLKLPSPFAETLATLSTRNKPKCISQKKWDQILLSLSGLLSGDTPWLYQIIDEGWGVTDVFGCHPTNPQDRVDCMGLLLLLKDREVIKVSRDCFALKTKYGATQSYRHPLAPSPEQTTLDLLPEEELTA
jgi:hypothetical protein